MEPKSRHFSLSEFEGRGPCPEKFWGNIQLLMDTLETIRATCGGKSITITPAGGYRSPEVNKKKKGRATKSQHLLGRAADIRVAGMTSKRVFYLVRELQASGAIPKGGLACYPTFVHVDIRGHRARWKPNP